MTERGGCPSHDEIIKVIALIPTIAESQRVMFEKIDKVFSTIYGNGTPGLKQDLAVLKERVDTMDKKEASRTADRRAVWPLILPWAMAIGGFITAFCEYIR